MVSQKSHAHNIYIIHINTISTYNYCMLHKIANILAALALCGLMASCMGSGRAMMSGGDRHTRRLV